jgi:membrane protease YdiL (CAAX protease family)
VLPVDSATTRWVLAAAFLALVVFLAIRAVRKDRREYQRFKRYRTTKRRQRMLRRWLVESLVVFGSASVVLLFLAGNQVQPLLSAVEDWPFVSVARRWLDENAGLAWGLLLGALLGAAVSMLVAVRAVRKEGEIPTVGDIHALLPRNRDELALGAALSINAGIVEELLFRLALPAVLFGATGNAIVAVGGSVVFFGFLHAYQGVSGVIGTTVVGALLMLLFIGTGSIAVAIIAHAVFDLRSLVLIPMLVYGVHKVPGTVSGASKAVR